MPPQTSNSSIGRKAKSELLGTPFKCPFPGCGKAYKAAGSYKNHSLKHTGKKLACRIHCGETFTDPKSRNRHEKLKHGPESELRYYCPFCEHTPTKRSDQLMAHLRDIHSVCKDTSELALYRVHLSALEPSHQQSTKSRRGSKSHLPAKFKQSAKSKRATKLPPPANTSSSGAWICTSTSPAQSDDTQRQATIAATLQTESQLQYDVIANGKDAFPPAQAFRASDWCNQGLSYSIQGMSEFEVHSFRMSLPHPDVPQFRPPGLGTFFDNRYLAPSSSQSCLSNSRSATPELSYVGSRSDDSQDMDMSYFIDESLYPLPLEPASQYEVIKAQFYAPPPFDGNFSQFASF